MVRFMTRCKLISWNESISEIKLGSSRKSWDGFYDADDFLSAGNFYFYYFSSLNAMSCSVETKFTGRSWRTWGFAVTLHPRFALATSFSLISMLAGLPFSFVLVVFILSAHTHTCYMCALNATQLSSICPRRMQLLTFFTH